MSALQELIVKHKESNEPITTLENVILNAWYSDFVDVDKAAAELAALRDEIANLRLQLIHYEIGAEEQIEEERVAESMKGGDHA